MTEILMMTPLRQNYAKLRKKRALHPSSVQEPDIDFRKLVDKLEQVQITMKLEETEKLKLQYVTTFKQQFHKLIISKTLKTN